MRLAIISNMRHYTRDGVVYGWGPTAIEISHLATLFDSVNHIAGLHPGEPPESCLRYTSAKVRLTPLVPSGGSGILAKLGILTRTPSYIRAILDAIRDADVVHVRCPANIPLLAVIVLCFVRQPKVRWIKYAGNWSPVGGDPLSYRFQRWMLRGSRHRAQVTVNGEWPNQPAHIHTFLNPCVTDEELTRGRAAACAKSLTNPVRLLFVGRVETPKGAGRALEIVAKLREAGSSVRLDIVGDGPERPKFEQQVHDLRIDTDVHFHGWQPRTGLETFLEAAHFLLLPTSASEGWPKVLSEGMAYGVVPIAGDVSGIAQTLARYQAGAAVQAEDTGGFVREISRRLADPEAWKEESLRCCHAARESSYSAYLSNVSKLLGIDRVCA